MIRIVGQENCSRCQMVKSLLDSKKISYQYQLMSSLSENDQSKIIEQASAKGLLSFPIIIDDEQVLPLSEVI